jgi:hypothetical protein
MANGRLRTLCCYLLCVRATDAAAAAAVAVIANITAVPTAAYTRTAAAAILAAAASIWLQQRTMLTAPCAAGTAAATVRRDRAVHVPLSGRRSIVLFSYGVCHHLQLEYGVVLSHCYCSASSL